MFVCVMSVDVIWFDVVSVMSVDMRKSLSMDVDKKSMIPLSRDVRPDEVE